MTYSHSRFHGKYIKWKNGLIFKVLGPAKEFADCTVEAQCPLKGNTWVTNSSGLKDEDVITEEEAKKRHTKIEVGVGSQFQICTCCAWKVGKPQLQLFLDLKDGRLSANEGYVLQGVLEEFFKNPKKYFPRIHPTDTGMEIEFYSSNDQCPDHRTTPQGM